jgi:hypothetical protein
VTGGYEDNQINFKDEDVALGIPTLQSAQWRAKTGGDSSLSGGAVGELWQWVSVCPGVHYGFTAAFYAPTSADCTVQLNISGIATPDSSYPFGSFVGSDTNWNVLESDVALVHTDQILIGIQLYCSQAGVTSNGVGNIDAIELMPLKVSLGGLGGYTPINGPYEEEGYDFYGDY